nr:hypothetical protein [uncultured Massilia sp.]
MAIDDRDVSDNNKDAADAQAASATPAADAHHAALSRKGAARRRFAKASAGATGVLLTLHSQPGMACTFCGISPSLAVSAYGAHNGNFAALSHRPKASRCAGIAPDEWLRRENWPLNKAANFGSVFACGNRTASFAGVTVKDMIKGASCDTDQMGKYMLAAYMNIADGKIDFVSIEALYSVWNEWSTKGYYEPMAGQRWDTWEIMVYLRGIMD